MLGFSQVILYSLCKLISGSVNLGLLVLVRGGLRSYMAFCEDYIKPSQSINQSINQSISQPDHSGHGVHTDIYLWYFTLCCISKLFICTTALWVRSRRWACLVTWFCYHLIAKPGDKTGKPSFPDPYIRLSSYVGLWVFVKYQTIIRLILSNHIWLFLYHFISPYVHMHHLAAKS